MMYGTYGDGYLFCVFALNLLFLLCYPRIDRRRRFGFQGLVARRFPCGCEDWFCLILLLFVFAPLPEAMISDCRFKHIPTAPYKACRHPTFSTQLADIVLCIPREF